MKGRRSATVRVALASALSGVVMLAATGCSPELRPLAAVYVDRQGTAHALLRSCDDDARVRAPELRGTVAVAANGTMSDEPPSTGASTGALTDTGPGPTSAEEPWVGWTTRGTHRAADFPLFAPPSAWAAETRGPRSLRPGHSYELRFGDPDDSYVYSASVTFDADRLAQVPTGEVLTLRGTMTKEAFEVIARQAC